MNNPPAAFNQSYSIREDEVLTVPAATGVLRGATDANGDQLEVLSNSLPPNGNISMQLNGSFVYVPNPNFNGVDRFEFVITDNKGGIAKGWAAIQIGEGSHWEGWCICCMLLP